MSPFRIEVRGECAASLEQLRENARRNAHHPRIERRKLAVAGGGPLLVNHLDELRQYPEIWAINRTAEWLRKQGIPATLFTVDPLYIEVDCEDRLLASCCHPDMFVGNCRMFDLIETHPDGISGGQSSAVRAPLLALKMGYTDINFFGCECSFTDSSHIDRDDKPEQVMIIRAGGADYKVTPDMLIQCEELSQLLRTFDGAFHNRSGGLLKAMIENPDTWECVGVSAALKVHLERNGPTGRFDIPYEQIAA